MFILARVSNWHSSAEMGSLPSLLSHSSILRMTGLQPGQQVASCACGCRISVPDAILCFLRRLRLYRLQNDSSSINGRNVIATKYSTSRYVHGEGREGGKGYSPANRTSPMLGSRICVASRAYTLVQSSCSMRIGHNKSFTIVVVAMATT